MLLRFGVTEMCLEEPRHADGLAKSGLGKGHRGDTQEHIGVLISGGR